MSVKAVRVQGLGKQYRIGGMKQHVRYFTLRDAISERVGGLLRKSATTNGNSDHKPASLFWALKDLDMTVDEGEVLGVIGRNGSGKSTLLKILSDIVEPTEGRAEIRGRVASLLEVGTGFHSELTGRENIYLNGALLGMSRHETRRNFDQIVEFAGIGPFIDTPVKRYSSGMYVRLGFAVAAHLEPQVLIVDEVLAVGDVEFQQRCMGRMQEVARGGRTVLFVSHNMAAVESLCTRCVLLDGGRLVQDGEPYQITREYRRSMSRFDGGAVANLTGIEGAARKVPILTRAHLVDDGGELTTSIAVTRPLEIRVGVQIPANTPNLLFVVRIDSIYATRMMTLRSPLRESMYSALRGEHEIVCRVPEFPLAPGAYRIGLAAYSGDQLLDSVNDVLSLMVTDGDQFGEGRGAVAGMCVARSEWGVASGATGVGEASVPDGPIAQPMAVEAIAGKDSVR